MAKSRNQREAPRSEDTPRRNFLVEFAAIAAGAIGGLVSLGAGLMLVVDPLVRDKKAPAKYREGEGGGAEGFVKVATLDTLPDDGVPRRFPVLADRMDAWNFTPDQPIGAVFMRREPGTEEVQVFHSTCPHAGCAVTFKEGDEAIPEGFYHCPCHNSAFSRDGEKLVRAGKENPSPRSLDTLEVDQDRLAESGEIWVKFMDFYTGIHEKKPKI